MRFFYNLGIYFYLITLVFIGGSMIAFSFNWIETADIFSILEVVYSNNYNSHFILGLIGFLIIVLAISFAQILMGKLEKEKTIAFSNPSGQVTVALSAVEDLIKRLTAQIPEIKESRSDVRTVKKGILEVYVKIILRSETNIPDLTSNLQELIKNKLREILPLEEQVVIKIHVAKIISQEAKDFTQKEEKLPKNPAVPFRGYGR